LPLIATAPVGIALAGATAGGGAGFKVSDIGDVTADGYDDYLIGAPSVSSSGGVIVPASSAPTVYLVFGSRTVTGSAISDWLLNNATGRVGDLGQLGNSANTQQNPITGLAGFPFDGIKFVTSQTAGSQLGVSVAEAGVINGTRAFLIGAPGANDINGANAGTGRAYLIYGGAGLLNVPNKTIDLDNAGQNSGVSIVTFVNTAIGSQTGYSVAGVGDVITDGLNDIVIGAPAATANGLSRAGAVYLLSGTAIPSGTTTINLNTVGQSGGLAGAIFIGATSGAAAGWSVAGAGNVDGALTTANQPIQDLLIGAPDLSNGGPGNAYLIYGSSTLASLAANVGGANLITLDRVGSTTATPPVPGLDVKGSAAGDQTGWAVSSAGDFNADGLSDFLVGSPGFLTNEGRADLFYGQSVTGNRLSGSVTLGAIPTNVSNLGLTGSARGDLAGYSVSLVGKINNTKGNPIIIGAPGFATNQGTAYLIPSNPGQLQGTFSLAGAESQPVAATQFTFSNPSSTIPSFFGASVSGRLTQSGQLHTGDSDLSSDPIIGAPGFVVNSPGRSLAGGAFVLEGALIPLKIPASTTITTQIGIDTPFGPFTNLSPTTPTATRIFVFSNATVTPAFAPVTQIDPRTVVINGVAFPTATIAADPVDENKDGIPDAIITITPRSNINLTSTTTSLTVSGRTFATGPNANMRWAGTIAITVAGGGTGGGGGASTGFGAVPPGTIVPSIFVPPLGPDRYVPPISALSALGSYKPIPYRVAIHQFLPGQGFAQRTQQFFHPSHVEHQFGSRHDDRGGRTSTLGRDVFTRGKYKAGKVFTFTHSTHVIPSNLQTERLGGQPAPFYHAHPKKR
jgi:hypothetical protein